MIKDQTKFARKNLSQNFLHDQDILDRIIGEAGYLRGKNILEIGPGLGALTQRLLNAGAHVTAVELDERVISILNKKFIQEKNFTLIFGDILQQNLDKIFTENYAVIANIPYNITNPILRKLLEKTQNQPEFAILMVQKEVGHKICDPQNLASEETAPPLHTKEDQSDVPSSHKILTVPQQGLAQTNTHQPKTSKRSILSISVEIYATAKYCFTVDRNCFDPVPKVDSAIIRLNRRPQPMIGSEFQKAFFIVVNGGFSEKRKKIGNVIGKFFGIPPKKLLGSVNPNRRAETLSIEEWKNIADNFRKNNQD